MNDQKILVAYASQFGSTAEVAERVAETLCQTGVIAEAKWINAVTDLSKYDGVIIGSPIQYDNWRPEAVKFVTDNQNILSKIPVAYFFTCLTLAKRNEKTERQALGYAEKIAALAPQVQPVGIGRFGGVLNYSKLPFHFRLLFRGMSLATGVQEGDYRDWEAIRIWAKTTQLQFVDKREKLLARI